MSAQHAAADALLSAGLPDWPRINFDVACPHCAYNLRTLRAHRCPECGVALDWHTVLNSAARRSGVAALLQNDQPRWEAIDFDVKCGRCGYNLRTLTRPLCPECGLTFDWRIVLDNATFKSDFLFEHYWRRKPISSWLRTFRRGMRPRRFWRDVSLHDEIRPGPLWFLTLTSVLLLIATLHGIPAIIASILYGVVGPPPATSPFVWTPPSMTQRYADLLWSIATMPSTVGLFYAVFPGTCVLILLVVLATMCGLRQTLGKCRVRALQVLRVVSYSAGPTCVLTALMLISVCSLTLPVFVYAENEWIGTISIALMIIGPPFLLAYFLRAGLKHYLQLPRAGMIAIASTAIGFLFPAATIALISALRLGGWK